MNIADILIVALLILVCGTIVIQLRKNKKNGKCNCGCDCCTLDCKDRK